MPLFVTPGQLSRREELFHQLAQLTAAGVDLTKSAGLISRGLRGHEARQFGNRFGAMVDQGSTATEALRASLPWVSDFELAIVEAGEKSGRLDVTFQSLANHYAERAQLARRIIVDLAYPAFLYHFAILVLALLAFLWSSQSLTSGLATLAAGLLPLYGFTLLVLWSLQSQRSRTWRQIFERFTHAIPLVGRARRSLAIARMCMALEALISAGVTIIEAWEMAARASGSPAIETTVMSWRDQILAGRAPAELVNESRVFPEMFANLYATGEVTGKLDASLLRLRDYYLDDGTRKIQIVSRWVPILIYLMVALMIGYIVIRFWTNYYGQMMNAF